MFSHLGSKPIALGSDKSNKEIPLQSLSLEGKGDNPVCPLSHSVAAVPFGGPQGTPVLLGLR